MKQRIIVVVALLLMAVAASAQSAEAQYWWKHTPGEQASIQKTPKNHNFRWAWKQSRLVAGQKCLGVKLPKYRNIGLYATWNRDKILDKWQAKLVKMNGAKNSCWGTGRPPHYSAWMCIHSHEGAWNANTGNGYYGGLQMDISFQRTYGAALLRTKGYAHRWTPREQMWVAEKAYSSGRGFGPWPNTARYCGLL